MASFLLQDKVAIVTGASRGIGEAIASTFARQGATLAICARTPHDLDTVAAHIESVGNPVRTYHVDVSDFSQVQRMVKDVVTGLGKVDILVNNAGIHGPIAPIWKSDREQWMRAIEVNLFGTMHCIKAVIPYMMNRRTGKIINFSGGGEGAFPSFSAYACSKSAIVRFTETLAEELKSYGIDVNCVAPGPVNTRLLDQVLAAGQDAGEYYEKAKKQKESGGVPVERAVELVTFLASRASDKLTGRLLSAVWDDWRRIDITSISDSALYQMRRIDGVRFSEIR